MHLKKKVKELLRLAFCMVVDRASHKLSCIVYLKARHCVKFSTSLTLILLMWKIR